MSREKTRQDMKQKIPFQTCSHWPVNWHWSWQLCLSTPLSALHDAAWDSRWTASCNGHPQHRWRPKISCTMSSRLWEMPILCAVAETQPRGEKQFPDFTVQWSPRPAEEEHLCSLQVLRKRRKT